MEIMPPGADKFFSWERRKDVPQNKIVGEAETPEQVPGALKNFMDDEEIPIEARRGFQERIDFHTENGTLKILSFMVAKSGHQHKGWLTIERSNVKKGEHSLYEPGGFILEEGVSK